MTITATAPRAAAYRGKLRWWTELPLIAVIYALYSGARLLVRGDVDDAVEHGADILHFEQFTHLDPERFFNRLFTHHAFLGVPADFAYASLHYVITPSILVWLWLRRPTAYRRARTWLLASTLIGLVGFTLVPTAPPRLLPGAHGFIDTMAQYGSYGWWGTDASAPRGLGHLTNQYAAMPSLHVGWSLWCGIILWRYGRHRVVRGLGLLYPMVTALVVMGTANHYLMDAAAGVATMGVGFLISKPALRVTDRVQARVRAAFGGTPRLRGLDGPDGTEAAPTGTTVVAVPAGTVPAQAQPAAELEAGAAAPSDEDLDGTKPGGSGGSGEKKPASPRPVHAPSPREHTPDTVRVSGAEHAGRTRLS
ncbi:phosphatase PAP2 family protein [Streptomyces sp. NBC_01476]|uniref:phosphatase PAP2 family protein n=1 Tax=Streptomyces sp. NBC_01476 TaxID=2903881 RepID=UPI002E304446|nr:phosphatase PAP2 family protein [Streptomyces sp. NBC_01476]